jgi:hypothetical protein
LVSTNALAPVRAVGRLDLLEDLLDLDVVVDQQFRRFADVVGPPFAGEQCHRGSPSALGLPQPYPLVTNAHLLE